MYQTFRASHTPSAAIVAQYESQQANATFRLISEDHKNYAEEQNAYLNGTAVPVFVTNTSEPLLNESSLFRHLAVIPLAAW